MIAGIYHKSVQPMTTHGTTSMPLGSPLLQRTTGRASRSQWSRIWLPIETTPPPSRATHTETRPERPYRLFFTFLGFGPKILRNDLKLEGLSESETTLN